MELITCRACASDFLQECSVYSDLKCRPEERSCPSCIHCAGIELFGDAWTRSFAPVAARDEICSSCPQFIRCLTLETYTP